MKFRKMALAVLAATGLAIAPAMAEQRVSIGTGGTGGLFYVIGAGMASGRLLEQLFEADAEELTKRALAMGIDVPGWTLKPGSGSRQISNLGAARKALAGPKCM